MSYLDFLKSKIYVAPETGLQVEIPIVDFKDGTQLLPHQRDAINWALRGGRRALFESFGLGKTIQQLIICQAITKEVGGKALIVAPLGVRQEFKKDAENKLGITIHYVKSNEEVEALPDGTICITNYERVRDCGLNPQLFTVTSLDEASVLRSYGSKTYQTFLDKFKGVRYKYVCTATPSPNKYKELIHYAGYLEVMDTGQAQPLNSKILTPDGWKYMGEISIGDMVIAQNGEPTEVIGIIPHGVQDVYKITFSDGSSTLCTADHLWETQTQYERNACAKFLKRNPNGDVGRYNTVKSTGQIAQTLICKSTGSKNHSIPMVQPVKFKHRDVKLDPYLLGLLLGDGHLRETSATFSTPDKWIVEEIRKIVAPLDLDIHKNTHERKDGQTNYDYIISAGQAGKKGRGYHSNKIINAIKFYDLTGKRAWEKFVPNDYIFNSVEVRLNVLRGLMDTDGTISSHEKVRTPSFTTSSPTLASNVASIVQSLGGTVYISERQGVKPNGESGRILYKVSITLPNGINPFRLPRKANLVVDKVKYKPIRYVTSIEYVGKSEVQCINVDNPRHLYVTDDYICTHNCLTRFFKRDSTKANNLKIHPHKEKEFWLWMSTWALFITKPSDLGYSDEGYDLPNMQIHYHCVGVDNSTAGVDQDGQVKMFREAALGLKEAAKEKRDSLLARVAKMKEIIDADLESHYIIWHDLENERHEIMRTLPKSEYDIAEVYGSQDLDKREQTIIDFSDGKIQYLATKPTISGQGCNFQYHCHKAIFLGIGYEFNDFIQAIHRICRFQQSKPVEIHIIYAESEEEILKVLLKKWEQQNYLVHKMTDIIRENGLSSTNVEQKLMRTLGIERKEEKGKHYHAIQNDCVLETQAMPDNSVGLIVTSIPFSNHYEYTPTYNDFGHTDDNEHFFAQMDYLTPQLHRILMPGRVACIHVKDRILFGNATGDGMPTLDPFSDMTVFHFIKHGFRYMGRITIETDVVRENNQTYRLGWTEQCKDGSKMGVGCPEYVLLFRKLPTDTSKAYADTPVSKLKEDYTRGRWQIDARAKWNSSGNRLLTSDEIRRSSVDKINIYFKEEMKAKVYDYNKHIEIANNMDDLGKLPATFQTLDIPARSMFVWDDVNRMLTLNGSQSKRNLQFHICPLQFDIVDRCIDRYSNKGDVVLDPFGGLMTVPYRAIMKGRKGLATELNPVSYKDGLFYLRKAETEVEAPTLFDDIDI